MNIISATFIYAQQTDTNKTTNNAEHWRCLLLHSLLSDEKPNTIIIIIHFAKHNIKRFIAYIVHT